MVLFVVVSDGAITEDRVDPVAQVTLRIGLLLHTPHPTAVRQGVTVGSNETFVLRRSPGRAPMDAPDVRLPSRHGHDVS